MFVVISDESGEIGIEVQSFDFFDHSVKASAGKLHKNQIGVSFVGIGGEELSVQTKEILDQFVVIESEDML